MVADDAIIDHGVNADKIINKYKEKKAKLFQIMSCDKNCDKILEISRPAPRTGKMCRRCFVAELPVGRSRIFLVELKENS